MGPVRHTLAIALALLAWYSANSLWHLQDSLGPRSQPINVRFAEGTSPESRQALERQFGLVAAKAQEGRTGFYRVIDRSPENIAALLRSPQIEDTHYLDPKRLRVVIDQPGVAPWLRELLEREWLPYGAWLLTTIGFVLTWTARSTVRAAAFAAWRRIRAVVLEVPAGLEAAADPFNTLSPRREAMAIVALCAVFLAPILLNGPIDHEEAGLGVFSSQIYYRDLLLHGRWSYWLTNLGFGTPMPIGQRLDFHPVFALGSLISLRVALSAVWIVHVAVMAVYFRRLLAVSGLTPGVRLVFLALYLFSAPSFLLFYGTDWVSCLVPWTLYPVLVYYVRDAATGGAASRWWLTTVRLGVLFTVWVINAHPGYLLPLFVALAVYTLTVARPTLPVYGALGTAGIFALAGSAERIYFLAHEKGFFPADVLRITQDGFELLNYAISLAPPLTQLNDQRQPFAGTFVFCAAVAAPFWWRRADRHVRGCIVAFFVAVAMGLIPVEYVGWSGLSGGWLFRDPMVFFGLLAAAAVVPSALNARRPTVRAIALLLVAVQGLQQGIVVWPAYRERWTGNNRLQWYRHQEHPIGLAAAMLRVSDRYGKRLYLSPRASDLSRGYMSPAGVHVVTDYALLGLNPVNAWFKNVAMDRIHPSPFLMHGMIRGQRTVVGNKALLDVLGINVVVAMKDEGLSPAGLTRLEELRVNDEADVEIFGNADAWPKAVLLSPDARAAALPVVEGCEHTAALCRDYTELARTRLPDDVSLREVVDGYRVHVPPSAAPRLLFLSAFDRPEWQATGGGTALAIEPIAGAFIGVTVPPGVQDVELRFRPPIRLALTFLSWTALAGMLLALAITGAARRSRASRKSP